MEIVKKHMITILCVLAIILLALPMVQVIAEAEASTPFGDFEAPESKVTVSGFNSMGKSIFAYLLVLGPAVLVAMNYVEQLGKYKGILAIAVPGVCAIALLIVLLTAKSFGAALDTGLVSVTLKVKWQIGAFLLFANYIGIGIAGAVTYHDFKLNKEGLSKLKESAGGILDAAQQKVSGLVQERQNAQQEQAAAPAESAEPTNAAAPAPAAKPAKKEPVSVKRVDEILALIEKLANMKNAGILTEEEFAEKKKQLLEEIR